MVHVLTVPTAGVPPGTGGSEKTNTGTEVILLLPAVIFTPCSQVLRIVKLAHLFWDFGSLFQLRQQQSTTAMTLRRLLCQLSQQRQSQNSVGT